MTGVASEAHSSSQGELASASIGKDGCSFFNCQMKYGLVCFKYSLLFRSSNHNQHSKMHVKTHGEAYENSLWGKRRLSPIPSSL